MVDRYGSLAGEPGVNLKDFQFSVMVDHLDIHDPGQRNSSRKGNGNVLKSIPNFRGKGHRSDHPLAVVSSVHEQFGDHQRPILFISTDDFNGIGRTVDILLHHPAVRWECAVKIPRSLVATV